jgi:hypothetical protein
LKISDLTLSHAPPAEAGTPNPGAPTGPTIAGGSGAQTTDASRIIGARTVHVEGDGKAVAATALLNDGGRRQAPVAPLLPRRCRAARATAVHVWP